MTGNHIVEDGARETTWSKLRIDWKYDSTSEICGQYEYTYSYYIYNKNSRWVQK